MIQSPKRELFSRRVVASPFPVVVCFAHSKCSSVFTLFSSQDTKIFERYRVVTDDQSKSELLSVLKLRYFTPREVANLHGFPSDFCECYFFTEWGIGISGFAVLEIFLIGFSVIVSKDFGFSVLVFNVVCGFFFF